MAEPDDISKLVACLENENEGIEHSSALKPFKRAARWIPIAVGPFINIDTALYAGAAKINHSEPPPDTEEGDLEIFKMILRICPDLKAALRGFNGDASLLKCLIGHMSTAASNSRSDDTSSCRKATARYISFPDRASPTECEIDRKINRGWHNRYMARLLCPLKRLPEFDRDPELFIGKVLDGSIKLMASQWPSFLYPTDAVYNPSAIDDGLFRGPILIHYLRNICTGPTSAHDGTRKASKPSKAEIHGMDRVFGRCVAYVAVQAYFSLSSIEHWSSSPQDGFFDLDDFFDRCVGLFERDPDDPWVLETLDYLTGQLPSLKRSYRQKRKRNIRSDSADEEEDETEAIYAQREARRLELLANHASGSNNDMQDNDGNRNSGGSRHSHQDSEPID